ncbi:MAG: hypothetical protein KDD82_13350 [Planctomycetes bacterium]|nr:hypothetical protein [Planctomycetota bacterium]
MATEERTIREDNVAVVEQVVMEAEVDAARDALLAAGRPPHDPGSPRFVRQQGTTCMSTSLANGMISLGEPFFDEDRERRVHLFTDDVVENTSSFQKPGEFRSVDDLFKYLESGRLRELEIAGGRFRDDYRVRLTCSLLDVVEALWSGRGRLLVQRAAHAYLVFGVDVERGGAVSVRVRDPFEATGPGYARLGLEALRENFLWSPLKKIPRLMGPHGFPQLTAEELLGHLERYEGMENLGVECPSALLFRAEDAPPLKGESEVS